ncbi:uncharacterized protein LOC143182628 [Calliopsis andreniformis]|uniref:uncharacterized protein LOC143182628 n=1 Tax=Calliopsis andreniformis TaxID=337506 RepID=UPI003FCDC5CA
MIAGGSFVRKIYDTGVNKVTSRQCRPGFQEVAATWAAPLFAFLKQITSSPVSVSSRSLQSQPKSLVMLSQCRIVQSNGYPSRCTLEKPFASWRRKTVFRKYSVCLIETCYSLRNS